MTAKETSVGFISGWIGDGQGLSQPEGQSSAAFQANDLGGRCAFQRRCLAGTAMHKQARRLDGKILPADMDRFQGQAHIGTVTPQFGGLCRLYPALDAGAARHDRVPLDQHGLVYNRIKNSTETGTLGGNRVFQTHRDQRANR